MAFLVRQERQELEGRLNAIESKQRQLEAQDRLISEALNSTSRTTVAESVRLKGANMGSISDERPCVPDTRLGYREYPIMSEHRGGTQLSPGSVTDVTSSKPVSILPSSSYSRMNAEEIAELCSKPAVENGLPAVPDHINISADSEVDTHTARIREYHDELLRRQTDRQHALLEARRRLQMRAEQLLDSGLNFLSESPSNTYRTVNHSQSLTVLTDKSHIRDAENYAFTSLSKNGVPYVENSDALQTPVDVAKQYKPELYQQKSSLSEDVEGFEYKAVVASPDDDDADDERQFVTPELREDGRVRPCRIAEYSPSPSPHDDDATDHSQQPFVSCNHNNVQSNEDDFNSLILQAQRDLTVRQQQMQDQLEALENEERRLAEQQLRISSQLGSFPSKIQTFSGTTHSQQLTALPIPYTSSSSDVVAPVPDRVYPVQNTANVSRDNTQYELSVSKDGLDMSVSRSDQKGRMTVDNTSPQTELHQIHMSRSAPQLQNCDHGIIPVTSEQLSPFGQSPVSTVFGLCLKEACRIFKLFVTLCLIVSYSMICYIVMTMNVCGYYY